MMKTRFQIATDLTLRMMKEGTYARHCFEMGWGLDQSRAFIVREAFMVADELIKQNRETEKPTEEKKDD